MRLLGNKRLSTTQLRKSIPFSSYYTLLHIYCLFCMPRLQKHIYTPILAPIHLCFLNANRVRSMYMYTSIQCLQWFVFGRSMPLSLVFPWAQMALSETYRGTGNPGFLNFCFCHFESEGGVHYHSCMEKKKMEILKFSLSGGNEGTALCNYLLLSLSLFICPHRHNIPTHDATPSQYRFFLRDRLRLCSYLCFLLF